MKVGVLGAGYWGSNVVRVCAKLGVLDSVCDADEAALASVGRAYPSVVLLRDVRALLERDIAGVLIAAPAPLHAELALEVIACGKHVFVEKPLAMSVDEAATVVRAAAAGSRTLFVGHVLLYHPAIVRLLELVREGAIGKVTHIRSRRLSWGRLRAQENVWWSFAPHDVALVLEIFGAMPESVRGATTRVVRQNIADVAYADLKFTNGRSAHIEVNWIDPDKSARLDVFGTEGVLRLSDSRAGAVLVLTPCGVHRDEFDRPKLWREEPREIAFSPQEPLEAEIRAFLNALERNETPITSGEEGLRVVQVLSMLAAQEYVRPLVEAFA
jgi:predicted dehydrogenase